MRGSGPTDDNGRVAPGASPVRALGSPRRRLPGQSRKRSDSLHGALASFSKRCRRHRSPPMEYGVSLHPDAFALRRSPRARRIPQEISRRRRRTWAVVVPSLAEWSHLAPLENPYFSAPSSPCNFLEMNARHRGKHSNYASALAVSRPLILRSQAFGVTRLRLRPPQNA
jgi:hypothetical protein